MDIKNRDQVWKLHYCKFCPYGSKSTFIMSKHVTLHKIKPKTDIFMCDSKTPELFKCEFCHFSTNLKVILTKHLRILHEKKEANEEMENIFKCLCCENCDFETHSVVVLANHVDSCKTAFRKNPSKKHGVMEEGNDLSKIENKKWVEFRSFKTKRKYKKIEFTSNDLGCEVRKRRRTASSKFRFHNETIISDEDNTKKTTGNTSTPLLQKLGLKGPSGHSSLIDIQDQTTNKTRIATSTSNGYAAPCPSNENTPVPVYSKTASYTPKSTTSDQTSNKILPATSNASTPIPVCTEMASSLTPGATTPDQNSNKTLTATPTSNDNLVPCCCNASMLLSLCPKIASSPEATSGFYDKVMSILVEIKEQNCQILDYIKNETRSAPSQVYKKDFPVDLPLISQESLDEFESFLKDKDNLASFSLYLSTLGGRNVVGRTNIILKYLITNQLASNYSFYGKRSQKKPFSELSIKHAVVQAIQRGLPNATEKEVEDAIKVWLKHAPQRLKTKHR